MVGPALAGSADVDGQPAVSWMEGEYPYLIVDQSLKDVLQEFGRNIGIDVRVSTRLKGRVSRYQQGDGPKAFLDGLASQHGFDWFFDGRQLHLTPHDEAVSRVWPVGSGAQKRLAAALAEAGVDDARFPPRFDSGRGTVSLSGPPAFMALVTQVVDKFVEPAVARTVNVIHGRSRDGGS